MKIFYTTDGSYDGTVEQVCPNGEVSHHTINGKEYSNPIHVGSATCRECPFCYGEGFGFQPYGYTNPKTWALFPVLTNHGCDDWGTPKTKESEQIALGRKQFVCSSDIQWIKCAKCFDKEVREGKRMRRKIWIWKHITRNIYSAIYKVCRWKMDLSIYISTQIGKLKHE